MDLHLILSSTTTGVNFGAFCELFVINGIYLQNNLGPTQLCVAPKKFIKDMRSY